MKKNKQLRNRTKIEFSPDECRTIIDASVFLDIDIYEFDAFAPGKIRACIGSAVAKLKTFDCTSDEKLPVTLNELVAIHWALSYTIDIIESDPTSTSWLDDSLKDSKQLSLLAGKIELFLLECNIKLV